MRNVARKRESFGVKGKLEGDEETWQSGKRRQENIQSLLFHQVMRQGFIETTS